MTPAPRWVVVLVAAMLLAFASAMTVQGEPADEGGSHSGDRDAVVIKGFEDMPADDQNKVLAGALFVAGMVVFVAYVCVQWSKE